MYRLRHVLPCTLLTLTASACAALLGVDFEDRPNTTNDAKPPEAGLTDDAAPEPVKHDTWSELEEMSTARYAAAAATAAGRIYVIGGSVYRGGNVTRLPTAEAFDPDTNTWKSIASMSHERYALGAAVGSDGRIYAIGGSNDFGSYVFAEAYTPTSNRWEELPNLPTGRYRLAVAAGTDGRIYAIGGYGQASDAPQRVEAYRPSSNTWETVAKMPIGRSELAAVTGKDGRIYAIGGYASGRPLATVEVYTPSTDTWETVASMSTARACVAAAVGADGRIYAIGGYRNTDSGASGGLATVEAYTPNTNTWAPVASHPLLPMCVAAATGDDGRIYVFGGQDETGHSAQAFVYTP